jgi:Glutathione S-transferase, N-terminal domain
MELYVCWGTFPTPWRPGGHPCGNAHKALREAGWDPEVKKTYGLGPLPGALTPQRSKVRELTGQNWVPVLVTDDGEVIRESKAIAEWARDNPASGAERAAGQAGGPGEATTT